MIHRLLFVSVVVGCCAAIVACTGGGSAKPSPSPTVVAATVADGKGNYPQLPMVDGELHTTPSGLSYVDIKEGTGATAEEGQFVHVKFTGWLPNGGSFTGGEQEQIFIVGAGSALVKGWDEAVRTMNVGGKRRLILPPDLAYGSAGFGSSNGVLRLVPPNATVIFDLELEDATTPTPAGS